MLYEVITQTAVTVVTLQAGAFSLTDEPTGVPEIEKIGLATGSTLVFEGYEAVAKGGIDLTKAQVIVSAGRGVGKPEIV